MDKLKDGANQSILGVVLYGLKKGKRNLSTVALADTTTDYFELVLWQAPHDAFEDGTIVEVNNVTIRHFRGIKSANYKESSSFKVLWREGDSIPDHLCELVAISRARTVRIPKNKDIGQYGIFPFSDGEEVTQIEAAITNVSKLRYIYNVELSNGVHCMLFKLDSSKREQKQLGDKLLGHIGDLCRISCHMVVVKGVFVVKEGCIDTNVNVLQECEKTLKEFSDFEGSNSVLVHATVTNMQFGDVFSYLGCVTCMSVLTGTTIMRCSKDQSHYGGKTYYKGMIVEIADETKTVYVDVGHATIQQLLLGIPAASASKEVILTIIESLRYQTVRLRLRKVDECIRIVEICSN